MVLMMGGPLPIPAVLAILMLMGCAATICHWVYYARRRPGVREFLDSIRPLSRNPFDESFLMAALLFDIAVGVGIYLLATGRM